MSALAGLTPLSLEALQGKQNAKWLTFAPDVLGMGIAEMDYRLAEPIRARLADMLQHERFGYPMRDARGPMAQVTRSFAARMERRFDWSVDLAQTTICVDLLQAIGACIMAFSAPGDGVLIQTPCYPAFLVALQQTGRRLDDVPMIRGTQGFVADPDPAASLAARQLKPRVLLLCQPHNPTGRCFTREELEPYLRLAEAEDMVIISDEIHADLVFAPHRHEPLAQMFPQAAARIITLYSATKSYNTPGLRCGVMHFGSAALMARFRTLVPECVMALPCVSAMEATLAAWEECDDWLDALVVRLDSQRHQVIDALHAADPRLVCHVPESTYFLWIDCSALEFEGSPAAYLRDQARVGVNDGAHFGPGWEGFVRLNFATTSALLDQVCARIFSALANRNGA